MFRWTQDLDNFNNIFTAVKRTAQNKTTALCIYGIFLKKICFFPYSHSKECELLTDLTGFLFLWMCKKRRCLWCYFPQKIVAQRHKNKKVFVALIPVTVMTQTCANDNVRKCCNLEGDEGKKQASPSHSGIRDIDTGQIPQDTANPWSWLAWTLSGKGAFMVIHLVRVNRTSLSSKRVKMHGEFARAEILKCWFSMSWGIGND